jgi:hypothetical protein
MLIHDVTLDGTAPRVNGARVEKHPRSGIDCHFPNLPPINSSKDGLFIREGG